MNRPAALALVSVTELAARLGIARQTVHYRILRGLVPPPVRLGRSLGWPEPVAAGIVAASTPPAV